MLCGVEVPDSTHGHFNNERRSLWANKHTEG